MKVGIMQPYFLPYIGYFQLISAVDLFIVYDNIKYTKKGWINRNRMLQNGSDVMFSLPLKSDSDSLDIRQRELAADFKRSKFLNSMSSAYRRAPNFEQTFPLVEKIVGYDDPNLFGFLHHSLLATCAHLGIQTRFEISSAVAIDHSLRSQDKVIALCVASSATTYINAIGGTELYSKAVFEENKIQLQFIRTQPFEYLQFDNPFVPYLSIVDVLMFNSLSAVQTRISTHYDLI
jgi:hypothetical protein